MNSALRDEILAILDGANDMTLATIRPATFLETQARPIS